MGNLAKAIAFFKAVGFERLSLNSFSDKVIAQKVIYLLQLKGVKLDFNYNLYLRGPYSPELAKEMYAHQSKVEKLETTITLSARENAEAREFKETFGLKPSILEAAATYSYFRSAEGQSALDALKNTKKQKPFLSETQIALGTNGAKRFLFPPSKEDIEDMKKEFAVWERAGIEDWGKIK